MYPNLSAGAIGIRAGVAAAIDLAARTGWPGVEIALDDAARLVAERSVAEVAGLLDAAGLRAGGAGLPIDWRAPYDRDALRTLAERAALGRRLGCARLHTWVMPASDDLPFRENFALHVERLGPIAAVLAEHGCQLGLEFIGPRHMRAERRYGFVYTLEAMLCLAQAVGPNAGLLVDSYHWYAGLGTLADLRSLRAEDVVYVHVNDAPAGVAVEDQHDQARRLPGATGVIDLSGFLQALRDAGYDGPVTPEPFDKSLAQLSPEQASRTTYEHLMEAWRRAGLG